MLLKLSDQDKVNLNVAQYYNFHITFYRNNRFMFFNIILMYV